MLINQKNNNDGQVPELAKIYKDVHFNPNTNRCIDHKDEATYVCVSFHPYHVCFFFFLSNGRKLFSKCKRIIVKILMQFPLHKRRSQTWFLRRNPVL